MAVKPLRIAWELYQPSTIPVAKLVLDRGQNTGALEPYKEFDVTTTSYTDSAVKQNRDYCYRLRAVSATGVSSDPTPTACARPRK